MINDLVNQFIDANKKWGDKSILDSYKPKEGLYIKINKDGSREYMVINEDRQMSESYIWFKNRDYYSILLDMNKPIDSKKKIHSNNYFTLFIKKDTLLGSSKTPPISKKEIAERINFYFDILENPLDKYKDKKSKKLFNSIKSEINVEQLNGNRKYILDNYDLLLEEIKQKKDTFDGYVKIFFDADINEYKKEYERYVIPNMFNKNNYNIEKEDEIFGLSNYNMGMNSKKPYLELKTMKCKVPFRVSIENCISIKKFFDWLSFQENRELYIPVDYKFNTQVPTIRKIGSRECHYLYITNGKEVIIEDYEFLPNFSTNIEFDLENILKLEQKDKDIDKKIVIKDNYFNQLWQLENEVDTTFFDGRLKKNYFSEPKIKTGVFTKKMQNILMISKKAFYNYFRKRYDKDLKNIVDRVSLDIVRDYILIDNRFKAGKAYNLRIALLKYFNLGGKEMGGKIKNMIEIAKSKISSDDYMDCSSDEEFYFLSGQLAYYILSKSKASKKTHDAGEVFLRAKGAEEVKKQLRYVYDRYKHAILLNDKRFNTAFSMVMGYYPESQQKLEDMFLAGLLSKNLFYESNKDKEENKGENEE